MQSRFAGGAVPAASDVVLFGLRIATLVGKVHALGYVHGDLKSANVIVRRQGQLSLVDFGTEDSSLLLIKGGGDTKNLLATTTKHLRLTVASASMSAQISRALAEAR